MVQVSHGAETLSTPEPGLIVLGIKSYGRNSAFLLKIGHTQVTPSHLHANPKPQTPNPKLQHWTCAGRRRAHSHLKLPALIARPCMSYPKRPKRGGGALAAHGFGASPLHQWSHARHEPSPMSQKQGGGEDRRVSVSTFPRSNLNFRIRFEM